jgi:hypothetical protein
VIEDHHRAQSGGASITCAVVERLADLTAPERARLYETAGIPALRRTEYEHRVRALIAGRLGSRSA